MAIRKKKTVTDANGAAGGPDIITNSNGIPNATLGQTLLGTTVTKSAVAGAANKKALYVIKDGSSEPVDQTALAAALAAGWKLLPGSVRRRFKDLTGATVGKSLKLYCNVVTDVTVGWDQRKAVYDRVTAAARTELGQDTTAGTPAQVVFGGNYFVFSTPYGGVAAGTIIPRNGLKGTVRFKEATSTADTVDSGLYTSYANGDFAV